MFKYFGLAVYGILLLEGAASAQQVPSVEQQAPSTEWAGMTSGYKIERSGGGLRQLTLTLENYETRGVVLEEIPAVPPPVQDTYCSNESAVDGVEFTPLLFQALLWGGAYIRIKPCPEHFSFLILCVGKDSCVPFRVKAWITFD